MPIGKRLREERERLGMSQPAFAAVVGTTKQTLFSWETGKTAPDGFQLAAFATAGADVLYILTGRREAEALSTEEKLLVERYRAADEATRYRILSSLLEGKTAAQAATDSNQVTQTITGMAGQVAGRDIKKR